MENLKEFCTACKGEKDILKVERNPQSEIIELSCGHRLIKVVTNETISLSDRIRTKHFNSLRKLKRRYKTKISGETKRPARDIILIDRERGKVIHRVWEQDPSGEWELVHYEEKSIPKMKKGKD